MNIALAIEHLDHRRGGAETYVHDFARWLLAQGHRVQILARSAHEPPQGSEVHLIQAPGLTRAAQRVGFAQAARARLAEVGADVSMATGCALGADVYQPHGGTVRGSERQNAALRRSDAARVVKLMLDRWSPKRRAARRLESEQFADARTQFVAVSEMVRRDMMAFYRVPAERIALVYNGIDTARFDPERLGATRDEVRRQYGIPGSATVLLMVAHNFKLKGLGETIRALGRLKEESPGDVHLVVAGRGRAGPYRRLARRLGFAGHVTFTGAVADAAPLYGAADAYVQPTWYDPCSLVVLEALASGLPVLTTRFNGASELMDGRGAGVVLDAPRPVARLAEGLRALLAGETRAGMGSAARGVAEEHPQERNFREMLDLLTRAAGAAGRA